MKTLILASALLAYLPFALATPPVSEAPAPAATPRVQPSGQTPAPTAQTKPSPFIKTASQSCAQVDYPCDSKTPCCEGLVCKPVGSYGSMCEKKQ